MYMYVANKSFKDTVVRHLGTFISHGSNLILLGKVDAAPMPSAHHHKTPHALRNALLSAMPSSTTTGSHIPFAGSPVSSCSSAAE